MRQRIASVYDPQRRDIENGNCGMGGEDWSCG
jgi:hypothetical protein